MVRWKYIFFPRATLFCRLCVDLLQDFLHYPDNIKYHITCLAESESIVSLQKKIDVIIEMQPGIFPQGNLIFSEKKFNEVQLKHGLQGILKVFFE